MKKILITGGAGYIGSILTKKMVELGYNVTVIDNLLYENLSIYDLCFYKNFNFINLDVSEISTIKGEIENSDIIIPLAALVGAPLCDRNKKLSKIVNYESIKTILKYKRSDALLIFPTTNSGYGVAKNEEFCTELSPLYPVSHYAKLKVLAEEYVLNFENTISLRLATVFGVSPRPRFDLLVNDFTYQSYFYGNLNLFEENFRRNFIHIRDVCETFIFCIKNKDKMTGNIYNVGLSSANLTKKELAEKIKNHIPNLKINFITNIKDPDKRDYLVSNKKIESLGWKPKFSLDDGITELIKSFKILKKNHFSNI